MAETNYTTLARPYAHAVFELAQEQQDYDGWSDKLAFMAAVARNAEMRALLDSPRLSDEQAAEMFIAVCNEYADDAARNFIRLLAENGRLVLLGEIAALYEHFRAEAENTVEAQLVSAQEVSEAQQSSIAKALEKRLGRTVKLVCKVDASLIGGAVIRAGDLVIDGSLRGRLNKLSTALAR